VHRILDSGLLLLHLGLGGCADLDDGDAADELREALLELLAVVVGSRVVDLRADLLDAARERFLAGLVVGVGDERGRVLVDRDALGLAEVGPLDVLELDAEVLGDELAAGEDRDVLEHGLAAIAEAGRLDGATLSVPRSLLTTSVARASPSMSSAMIRSGLPCLATCSSTGRRSFIEEIFFS
jgi:hypothetical protein